MSHGDFFCFRDSQKYVFSKNTKIAQNDQCLKLDAAAFTRTYLLLDIVGGNPS